MVKWKVLNEEPHEQVDVQAPSKTSPELELERISKQYTQALSFQANGQTDGAIDLLTSILEEPLIREEMRQSTDEVDSGAVGLTSAQKIAYHSCVNLASIQSQTQVDRSIDLYMSALQIDFTDSDIWLKLGALYYRNYNFQRALVAFTSADSIMQQNISSVPESRQLSCVCNVMECQIILGQNDEAMLTAERLLRFDVSHKLALRLQRYCTDIRDGIAPSDTQLEGRVFLLMQKMTASIPSQVPEQRRQVELEVAASESLAGALLQYLSSAQSLEDFMATIKVSFLEPVAEKAPSPVMTESPKNEIADDHKDEETEVTLLRASTRRIVKVKDKSRAHVTDYNFLADNEDFDVANKILSVELSETQQRETRGQLSYLRRIIYIRNLQVDKSDQTKLKDESVPDTERRWKNMLKQTSELTEHGFQSMCATMDGSTILDWIREYMSWHFQNFVTLNTCIVIELLRQIHCKLSHVAGRFLSEWISSEQGRFIVPAASLAVKVMHDYREECGMSTFDTVDDLVMLDLISVANKILSVQQYQYVMDKYKNSPEERCLYFWNKAQVFRGVDNDICTDALLAAKILFDSSVYLRSAELAKKVRLQLAQLEQYSELKSIQAHILSGDFDQVIALLEPVFRQDTISGKHAPSEHVSWMSYLFDAYVQTSQNAKAFVIGMRYLELLRRAFVNQELFTEVTSAAEEDLEKLAIGILNSDLKRARGNLLKMCAVISTLASLEVSLGNQSSDEFVANISWPVRYACVLITRSAEFAKVSSAHIPDRDTIMRGFGNSLVLCSRFAKVRNNGVELVNCLKEIIHMLGANGLCLFDGGSFMHSVLSDSRTYLLGAVSAELAEGWYDLLCQSVYCLYRIKLPIRLEGHECACPATTLDITAAIELYEIVVRCDEVKINALSGEVMFPLKNFFNDQTCEKRQQITGVQVNTSLLNSYLDRDFDVRTDLSWAVSASRPGLLSVNIVTLPSCFDAFYLRCGDCHFAQALVESADIVRGKSAEESINAAIECYKIDITLHPLCRESWMGLAASYCVALRNLLALQGIEFQFEQVLRLQQCAFRAWAEYIQVLKTTGGQGSQLLMAMAYSELSHLVYLMASSPCCCAVGLRHEKNAQMMRNVIENSHTAKRRKLESVSEADSGSNMIAFTSPVASLTAAAKLSVHSVDDNDNLQECVYILADSVDFPNNSFAAQALAELDTRDRYFAFAGACISEAIKILKTIASAVSIPSAWSLLYAKTLRKLCGPEEKILSLLAHAARRQLRGTSHPDDLLVRKPHLKDVIHSFSVLTQYDSVETSPVTAIKLLARIANLSLTSQVDECAIKAVNAVRDALSLEVNDSSSSILSNCIDLLMALHERFEGEYLAQYQVAKIWNKVADLNKAQQCISNLIGLRARIMFVFLKQPTESPGRYFVHTHRVLSLYIDIMIKMRDSESLCLVLKRLGGVSQNELIWWRECFVKALVAVTIMFEFETLKLLPADQWWEMNGTLDKKTFLKVVAQVERPLLELARSEDEDVLNDNLFRFEYPKLSDLVNLLKHINDARKTADFSASLHESQVPVLQSLGNMSPPMTVDAAAQVLDSLTVRVYSFLFVVVGAGQCLLLPELIAKNSGVVVTSEPDTHLESLFRWLLRLTRNKKVPLAVPTEAYQTYAERREMEVKPGKPATISVGKISPEKQASSTNYLTESYICMRASTLCRSLRARTKTSAPEPLNETNVVVEKIDVVETSTKAAYTTRTNSRRNVTIVSPQDKIDLTVPVTEEEEEVLDDRKDEITEKTGNDLTF